MHGTGQDDTEWHTSCDTRYLEFRPLVCWCVWTCMTQNKMGQHGAFQLLSMCVDNMCTGVHGTTWHWTRWDRLMHFNCYQCDKVLTKKHTVCWCTRHAWNWTRWNRQVHMEDFNCYQCACDLVSQTCALVNVELHGTGQNRSEWSFQWLFVCLRLENTCVGLFGTLQHRTQRGHLHSSLGKAHTQLSSAWAGYGLVHLHLHG